MTRYHTKHASRLSKSMVLTVAALSMWIVVLWPASSALAAEHHPTGDYAQFNHCPLSNPATEYCILGQTEKGKIIVGKETVPIANTITIQGGLHKNKVTETLEFIGAENAETVSKTPQKIPGGLLDLVKCDEISNIFERVACEAVFENGVIGVDATTELAEPASSIGISTQNLVEAKGIALSLPVKVHLENPLLGPDCYAGSNAHPVVIELTTGTTTPPPPNTPITGLPGHAEFEDEYSLIILKEDKLVNNSFAAPGVAGCGGLFSPLFDPIINRKLGLPAAAGHNTAILESTLKIANAPAVKASE
jgi:hypothetical protein